ncbi:MAG: phospho-sugar mutase [Cellulosilyticaceae bacterium]
MEIYEQRYNQWMTDEYFDIEIRHELEQLSDETEIKERFYKDLEFGTGGLRGIMGAGTNRMNIYTIRKATYGLAQHLLQEYGKVCQGKGVVIAYDSRNHSQKFAEEAALVLNSCGIKVYLFEYLVPTPELSFAVMYYGTVAGIVITASHNPKEYNGYKVYDAYGCQVVPAIAESIIKCVNAISNYNGIATMKKEDALKKGLLLYVGNEVDEAFNNAILKQATLSDKKNDSIKAALKIVYTPLHGAGNRPVRKALGQAGFTNLHIVEEQEKPDGNFSTVKSPNPEEQDALTMGIQYATKVGADIVLGTDPDCDRIGIAVKHNEKFVLLTGNQVGALLVQYVLEYKKNKELLNNQSTLVKTIVTSELGANIARGYGLNIIDTLTGFKFIGEQIVEFDKAKALEDGTAKEFVMGYEESYGYLLGTHAKDKDAVVSSLLICEMAAFYKQSQKDLMEVLQEIYASYGVYKDYLDSFTLTGIDGLEQIKRIMQTLRTNNENNLGGLDVKNRKDYKLGIEGLPKADVLKYTFKDGSWLAARPSGTEPKIKFYYSIVGKNEIDAEKKLQTLRAFIKKIVR